jgi:(p)ppGpp synthase/HD superfamily hydrolase
MKISPASKVSARLHDAMELAFRLHGHEARKSSNVPMMTHLFSVCGLVMHDGGDEEEAVAALLHDALEDMPDQITFEDIQGQFGERVAKIVEISSDTPKDFRGGPKPPWRERKEQYLAHIRRTDPRFLRVTVADKVDNVRSILADYRRLGESFWDRFNAGKADQLWYYGAVTNAYRETGVKGPLMDELERVVAELRLALES